MVAAAPRPIHFDARFVPRALDGRTTRDRVDRRALPAPRPASTLLVIYPGASGELLVPLTVRRDDLRSHAGEVSLPGGAVDPTDASREAAALREAWEEVALSPSLVRVAGALDDVWIPGSNFELRPFVGTVAERPTLIPHSGEVSAIVELPLAALWDPSVVGVEEFAVRGLDLRAGVFRYGGVMVWGATAITLGMLARVLEES